MFFFLNAVLVRCPQICGENRISNGQFILFKKGKLHY